MLTTEKRSEFFASLRDALVLAVGVAACGSWSADILSHPHASIHWSAAWFALSGGLLKCVSLLIPLICIRSFVPRLRERDGAWVWAASLSIAFAVPIRLASVRFYDAALIGMLGTWLIPCSAAVFIFVGGLSLHHRSIARGGEGCSDFAWTSLPAAILAWFVINLFSSFALESLQEQRPAIYALVGFIAVLIVGCVALTRHSKLPWVRSLIVFIAGLVAVSSLVGRGLQKLDDWRAWAAFPEGANPRLMLLTADTLRADGPHFMNPSAYVTPAMDSFASEGHIFRNASASAPWTMPSFAAMMTGQTPGVHGVVVMHRKLSEKFYTLAERLREHGYRTEAHVMNAYLRQDHGFDQGFERYHYIPTQLPKSTWNLIVALATKWPANYLRRSMNERIVMDVDRFLERRAGRPFFLWVHFLDPHEPLTPSDASIAKITSENIATRTFRSTPEKVRYTEIEKKNIQILYRAEVLDLDLALGNLISTMKSYGYYDETAISFTSDHGEAFWEHRGYGHGFALYQEQVHVPLVIRLGGDGPRGEELQPVSNARLFATFLDLAGITPEDELMEDQSLLPLVRGESNEPVPVYVSGTGDHVPPQHAITRGGHKLIRTEAFEEKVELYNLESDPKEKVNLFESDSSASKPMLEVLEEWLARQDELRDQFDLNTADITVELDAADYAELEAIGYFK